MCERPVLSHLEPDDLLAIAPQASQRVALGLEVTMTADEAERLSAGAMAWTVREGTRIICCYGIAEQFAGNQGLAWALLAEGIGASHLALTRFVRASVAACPLARVEALARAHDLENVLEIYPDLDSGQVVMLACKRPSPEIRWGMMVGLHPAHLLRCYGAHGESYMLMERLRPPLLLTQEAA